MTTYYVATRARYVLVEADNKTQARVRGKAALQDQSEAKVVIRIVRPATLDEIELGRWQSEQSAREMATAFTNLVGEPIIDSKAQAMTDWIPMSVPGRENADGTETPTAWFAFNRATRKAVEFGSFDVAKAFCFHPDNRRY